MAVCEYPSVELSLVFRTSIIEPIRPPIDLWMQR